MRRIGVRSLTVAAATLGFLGAVLAPTSGTALTPGDGFYTPPSSVPNGRPGTIIRSQPAAALALARATRIMYRSTDMNHTPIAVTGTVLDPLLPWTGRGPRPLVSVAVGTQGEGDECAPSKTLTTPVGLSSSAGIIAGYEIVVINWLLAQGMAVVVTDYQGLGTPGLHTWLNPTAEAHAVIDAARAARHVPGTRIPANGPVGFFGYSQGGQAAAASGQLAGSYAPELHVVGTFSGDGPFDDRATFEHMDGTIASGYVGYFLNGMIADEPATRKVIERGLNTAGKAMLRATSTQCIFTTGLRFGGVPSRTWTTTGQSITQMLDSNPLTRSYLNKMRVGTAPPQAPIMVAVGDNDDVVPSGPAKAVVRQWCARGATAVLNRSPLPTLAVGTGAGHIMNLVLQESLTGPTWLRDRFNGIPVRNACV